MGGPHLAPERKDGGEALALAGGATARATVERRANLASGVVGAEDGEGAGELRCYSGSKAKHGWFWLGARLRLVPYVSVGRGRWAGLCYSWAGSTRGRRREESPLSLSLSSFSWRSRSCAADVGRHGQRERPDGRRLPPRVAAGEPTAHVRAPGQRQFVSYTVHKLQRTFIQQLFIIHVLVLDRIN
jgi:hypothetical protein